MLILYSPLPTANTGTAVYCSALLDDLKAIFGPQICEEVIIAVDITSSDNQFDHARGDGWLVKDFRSLDRGEEDICVYFLASNPYHYYSYEQLATHTRGMCVSVIHDLTAAFFIREMKDFVASPYASLFDLAFSASLGVRGAALTRDYESLHDISRYFVSAQGVTLAKSDVILTHSYYAKSKLVLENNLTQATEDKILVCKHPNLASLKKAGSRSREESSASRFAVGSFGYYSTNKRFSSIVRAWSIFLKRCPEAQTGRLMLGGEIPKKEKRRLLGLCDPPHHATIEMLGFLPEHELHTLMDNLDLLVTLRFPSCGETSGLVAHALLYDTPIALSEFAAFREEPAAFRISVDPCEELTQLVNAFEETFHSWKKKERIANLYPDWGGPKKNLASYLGQLITPKLRGRERHSNAEETLLL